MASPERSDSPVHQKARTFGELYAIVQHPAFRLGFLDARAGRAMDHDTIMLRILAETPAGALKRLGWEKLPLIDGPDMFGVESAAAEAAGKRVEVAQYRYEEGRILFVEHGVRCRAWGHPDFPPVAVTEFCRQRFKEIIEKGG